MNGKTVLISHPIFCFESSQSVQYNSLISSLDPIVLFLNDNHYVAGLRLNENARIAKPVSNPLVNRFWNPTLNLIFIYYDY